MRCRIKTSHVQDLLDNKQQDQNLKEEEGKQNVWEDEHDSEFERNEDGGNQDEEDEEELEEQERAEEEEEENVEMHKMKARSLVWKYFRKTLPAMAACNLCGKEICTVGNNTSGMIKHLSAIHYELNFQVIITSNLKCIYILEPCNNMFFRSVYTYIFSVILKWVH